MAEIRIQAVLDRGNFDQQARALQEYINNFSNQNPIRIQLDGDVRVLQSLARLATAASNAATAEARLAEAHAREVASTNAVAIAQERTAQAHERTEQAAIRATAAQINGANDARNATNQLGDAAQRVSEVLSAMAIRGAWRIITSEIREALSAMREVDKELVTIRKVTGFSQSKINEIGQSAYQTASQYGVLPQEYLTSVASFARAGYKETSTSLGELAVKTQLVGDVTQDTANKMLLAVDAAYQLHGNTEALSSVLDGMNEIDNNFATSIDKIASGIGKVTSIGAQAHVSIGELSSAIGTITAVTQRSGTEAATALRALFLNIMGDTKTEIEDGAKWTAGEIKGLRDVLAQYAPEVVNAAAATGQLINPMEAIGALAQSMKDGLLSEQQLMAMVSDIGGKLRSSQLLALIQNWDMYQSMLSSFENSAGSAGREVANMLDSWDVKANQLSTSWTKMVADVMDTGFVKGTLDFLRSVTEMLDAGGGIPAKLIATATAIAAIGSAVQTLGATQGIQNLMALLGNHHVWIAAGAVVAISGLVNLINDFVFTQAELNDNANRTAESYTQQHSVLVGINKQIEENRRLMGEIAAKGEDATDIERDRLEVLKQQTAELELQKKIEDYKTDKAARESADAAKAAIEGRGTYSESAVQAALGYVTPADVQLGNYKGTDINNLIAYWQWIGERQKEVDEQIKNLPDGDESLGELDEYRDWLETAGGEVTNEIMQYLADNAKNANTLDEYLNKYVRNVSKEDRKGWQNDLLKFYEETVANAQAISDVMGITEGTPVGGTTTGVGGTTESSASAWELASGQKAAQFLALNQAIKEFNQSAKESTDVVKISKEAYDAMAAAGLDVADSLIEADDGYVVTAEDLQKMADATKAWYEKYGLEMPGTLGEISAATSETSATITELANNALTLQDNAYGAAKALDQLKKGLKETGEKGDTFKALQTEYANVMKLIEEGRWNSNEARGFMDMLFGPDAIKEVGGYQVMSEWLGKDYFKSFFTDDALTTLEKWAKTLGEVKDENGELIASFAKNDDGTFDVLVNDIDKLSQKLKIPSDMLAAFFDELGNFGNVEDFGDVEKLVDGMSEGVETLANGTKKVDFASFVQQLQDAGVSAQKISELVSTIRDSEKMSFDVDGTGIKDAEVWVRDLWASLKNLQDETFKPKIQAEDDTEDGVTSAEKNIDDVQQKSPARLRVDTLDISAGAKNAQSLIDKIKQDNPPKLTAEDDTKEGVDDAQANIDSLKQTEKPKLAAEDDTDNGVDCAQSNIDSLEQTKVPPLKANDEITPVAKDVQGKIDSLKGKTVDLKVNYKAAFDGIKDQPTAPKGFGLFGPNGLFGGDSEASGTDFAAGGPTLVNEKGPELIAQNGRAFVANSGRPTIVNLSRGAIVYNADETRELLVGSGISSYGIESRAVGTQITPKAFGVTGITPGGGKTDDKQGPPTGGGKTKKKKTDDEWWQILQESYEYALAKAKDTVNQLDLKITHIKNEIADAKRPLEDQIKEYEKINKQIDRQIQLLNRAKERATKPIQDQIDALKAQKDVQDEQLALEEKQKAVEEARAALQNAQQERTIRYYNQETGHWEWMADQRAIDDAQKNLDSAEKALADQEFNMQISALEREKDRIEKEFDDQITQLNEQKTVNEDAIYALNEAIDAIDDAYAPELNALEREKELMDRELADTEAEWAHLQFQRQKKPKGNVNKAANKLGAKGKAAKEIIDSLSGSIKDIESAAAAGTLDALTASVANSLIYGSPSTVTSAVGTGIGSNGGMADSHDIIINGIVFSNEGAYKSFTDGLAALGIYAGE